MKADNDFPIDVDSSSLSPDPLTCLSDGELAERWRRGDQDAAGILNDRHRLRLESSVARRLSRRLRSLADPEDLVQSAMNSFFRAVGQSRIRLDRGHSASRFLATIAKRKLLRLLERESALKRGGRQTRLPLEDRTSVSNQPPRSGSPSLFFSDPVSGIGPSLRPVAELLIEGLRQDEIATSLGISVRTVRRRIRALAEHLKPTAPSRFEATSGLPRIDYRQFVLGRWIGSGGFSKVYRATLQSDDRVVAVKFLRKRFWQHKPARDSFLREVAAASEIAHAGIIRYLGWGESPHGGPYVVSEWINGTPLSSHPVTSLDRKTAWLLDLCKTLRAIHDSGLVHGDLTPGNVMITGDHTVVLTDFGFASRGIPAAASLNDDEAESHVDSRTLDPLRPALLGGTPGFAAPEQVSRLFGSIDRRTDLYAVGGLAYWLLTGKPPHQIDGGPDNFASSIAAEAPAVQSPIGETRAGRKLRDVAGLALRQAINDRPMDAEDLIAVLS